MVKMYSEDMQRETIEGRFGPDLAEDESKAASRAQWSAAAEGWADAAQRREGGPSGAAADWMLDAARLAPGERVLELACGAGDVGILAAEAVGPTGRVVCSDFAEPMVEVARERTAGLPQVEVAVLDAEALDTGGERFDAVLCRFGYMLMSRPAVALENSFRVLDPGGRVALAVWGDEGDNPWLSLLTDAIMKTLGAPPPEPGTPGPFALSDHQALRRMLEAAGFGDVVVEDLASERRQESLEHWWGETLQVSGPISAILSQLSDEQVEAIRTDALAAAAPYAGDDGAVVFPARVVVASARR
jgi:SAM-dependent methyltransferase